MRYILLLFIASCALPVEVETDTAPTGEITGQVFFYLCLSNNPCGEDQRRYYFNNVEVRLSTWFKQDDILLVDTTSNSGSFSFKNLNPTEYIVQINKCHHRFIDIAFYPHNITTQVLADSLSVVNFSPVRLIWPTGNPGVCMP